MLNATATSAASLKMDQKRRNGGLMPAWVWVISAAIFVPAMLAVWHLGDIKNDLRDVAAWIRTKK